MWFKCTEKVHEGNYVSTTSTQTEHEGTTLRGTKKCWEAFGISLWTKLAIRVW